MGTGTGIGKTYTTYKERTTSPATPSSTYVRLFFKADGIHYINSSGTDVLISGTANMTAVTDPAGTPTFAAVTTAIVDGYSGVVITLTAAGNAQTIQSPTATTVKKTFTVVNNDTSTHSIAVNGITIPAGKAQSFIWDGTAWGPTDLGITALPVPINQGGTGAITAADAFTALKQSATTSATGVVELATQAEVLAGTDTSRAVVPVDLAAKVAIDVNPRVMAQSVALTYAASGSSGIQVPDNDNINFGVGNFALVWKGSLPDWTPTETAYLHNKYVSDLGYFMAVIAAGNIFVRLSATISFQTTVVNPFVNGTIHEIVAVVTNGATSSVTFYADGIQLGDAVAGTAYTSLNNAASWMAMTNFAQTARTAGTVHHAYTLNFAPTAAEVLDLYRNGIPESWKGASQIALNVSTCVNSSFNTFDGESATGFHVVANTAGTKRASTADEIVFVLGKKYQVSFNAVVASGTGCVFVVRDVVGGSNISDVGNTNFSAGGSFTTVVTITTAATGVVEFNSGGADCEFTISNLSIKPIGATLALESEGIQPAPGQWLDSSSNKLHAMLPAAGASLTRFKKDFEFRWTNTWTASSAAQYIGGLNQAVLSVDHFITSITTQATVTTDVENLTLGDGSDADRFVTAFAPSATRTSQTIAAQNDGTNLKLVYTPAAEATMTVETIIRGFIWEP